MRGARLLARLWLPAARPPCPGPRPCPLWRALSSGSSAAADDRGGRSAGPAAADGAGPRGRRQDDSGDVGASSPAGTETGTITIDARGLLRGMRPPAAGPGAAAAVAAAAAAAAAASGPSPAAALVRHLQALIRFGGGPLSVAEFMQHVLTHPSAGYYMRRDVFGSAGDFTTSPEVSQMFGELIGIWAVATWQQLGSPPQLQLVELGPGRGTLMADLLRGTRRFRAFASAVRVHLVEVSPALRRRQYQMLDCTPAPLEAEGAGEAEGAAAMKEAGPQGGPAGADDAEEGEGEGEDAEAVAGPSAGRSGLSGAPVRWHKALDRVPAAGAEVPVLIIGHEFIDALPVHQFVRTERGWCERLVAMADGSSAPEAPPPAEGGEPRAARPPADAELPPPPVATSASASALASPFRFVLSPGTTAAARALVPARLAALHAEAEAAAGAAGLSAGRRSRKAGTADPVATAAAAAPRSIVVPPELEICPAGMAVASSIARRVSGPAGGAALLIDYGYERPGPEVGHTLQAIRDHRFVDVLDGVGDADLSAYVDFGALKQAVRASGAAAAAYGPVPQGSFLRALGIDVRLQQLLAAAGEDQLQAEALQRGYERLVGDGTNAAGFEGMGGRYGVLAIASNRLGPPVGFEPPPEAA